MNVMATAGEGSTGERALVDMWMAYTPRGSNGRKRRMHGCVEALTLWVRFGCWVSRPTYERLIVVLYMKLVLKTDTWTT